MARRKKRLRGRRGGAAAASSPVEAAMPAARSAGRDIALLKRGQRPGRVAVSRMRKYFRLPRQHAPAGHAGDAPEERSAIRAAQAVSLRFSLRCAAIRLSASGSGPGSWLGLSRRLMPSCRSSEAALGARSSIGRATVMPTGRFQGVVAFHSAAGRRRLSRFSGAQA